MSSLNDPRKRVRQYGRGARALARDLTDPAKALIVPIDEVRAALRFVSLKDLRDHVDLYLVAEEEASARGDHVTAAHAGAVGTAFWNEIERREAIHEAAS